MLYGEYRIEDEIAVVKEEAWEDGHAEGHSEGRSEERRRVLELLNQGLSVEEIKERLGKGCSDS